MHGIDLPGLHGGEPVRRTHCMEDVALEGDRREVGHLFGGEKHRLVLRGPIGLALLHEVGDRGKRVVVHRHLDVEDPYGVFDDLALADA